MFLCLPTYESYILHNHKIIFTIFGDGSLWSSGRKPHLKLAFVPCGLFAQSIYSPNSEIHRTVYFLKKSTKPYLLQFHNFCVAFISKCFKKKLCRNFKIINRTGPASHQVHF